MAQIYHFDLYGRREDKYKFLLENDVYTVEWKEVSPQSPYYLFSPQNRALLSEYNEGWKITDVMPKHIYGFKSHRDHFAIGFDKAEIQNRINELLNAQHEDNLFSIKYNLGDWNWRNAAKLIQNSQNILLLIDLCAYRPFDNRFMMYSDLIMDRTRPELRRNIFQKNNLCFVCSRQVSTQNYYHFFTTDLVPNDCLISNTTKESNHNFPLYLYPDTENEQGNLLNDRTPNLSQKFLTAIREKLNYIPTPEAIFYYAYAIFHSPTYRQRYAEFLKIDFPRLPLTSNNDLFQALSKKGKELVELHLMKSKKLNKVITKYPVSGDNAVTEVTYKQDEQRIYINKQQYFEGIAPEVWVFKIGGYQVLDKWLKDRKKAKRSLSFDDVLHYQRVIVALKETMQIMTEIDQLIPSFPIE